VDAALSHDAILASWKISGYFGKSFLTLTQTWPKWKDGVETTLSSVPRIGGQILTSPEKIDEILKWEMQRDSRQSKLEKKQLQEKVEEESEKGQGDIPRRVDEGPSPDYDKESDVGVGKKEDRKGEEKKATKKIHSRFVTQLPTTLLPSSVRDRRDLDFLFAKRLRKYSDYDVDDEPEDAGKE
jgi:hypothetical protein